MRLISNSKWDLNDNWNGFKIFKIMRTNHLRIVSLWMFEPGWPKWTLHYVSNCFHIEKCTRFFLWSKVRKESVHFEYKMVCLAQNHVVIKCRLWYDWNYSDKKGWSSPTVDQNFDLSLFQIIIKQFWIPQYI